MQYLICRKCPLVALKITKKQKSTLEFHFPKFQFAVGAFIFPVFVSRCRPKNALILYGNLVTIDLVLPDHLILGVDSGDEPQPDIRGYWMRESVVVTLDRYKVGRGGSFIIHQVHLNGVVELLNSNSTDTFKVNGHRFKTFIEPFKQENEEINPLEPQKA